MIDSMNINKEILIGILLSLYEVVAININLDIIKGKTGGDFLLLISDFTGSFHAFSLVHYFEWYCFYRITKLSIPYFRNNIDSMRDYLCIGVPSAIFSLSMIIGFSFQRKHSLELFWGSTLQIIKSLTAFSGYFPLFLCTILCLYMFFDNIICHMHDEDSFGAKYKPVKILYNHPLKCLFFMMIVASLPYVIFSYPGYFWGDPCWQISQMINAYTIDPDNGLKIMPDKITLNNHHPVLHTILLNVFVFIGKMTTDSYNIGLFLYTLFQCFCVIACISLIMVIIIRILHIRPCIALALLCYYVIHPYMQLIMTLCTKDAIYSSMLILFITASFTQIMNYKFRHQNAIWFSLAIGLILLRNEGIFIVLSMMGYQLFFCDRKLSYIYLINAVILFFVIHLVVFPLLNVTPGSIREALSIPFQQTARYVKFAGNEITDEERKAISRVLRFNKLAEIYNGRVADPVKNTFNRKVAQSELLNYISIWLEMLKKHPAIYIEAVLDKNYDFFYFSNQLWGEFWVGHSQDKMNQFNIIVHTTDFGHPKSLDYERQYFFSLHRKIIRLPIIGLFGSSALYIWLCIIWFSFCIKRNSNRSILLLVPFLLQLLVNIAGPNNGSYFRYMYIYVLGLLPAIIYGMEIIKLEESNEIE